MRRMLRTLAAFIAAVVITAALGSLWQTQLNLAALAALGHAVGPSLRLATSAQDLAGFAPLYAVLCAIALLIAFIVAALLARALPRLRMPLHLLAGGTAVAVMLVLMDAALPVTIIAAARGLGGTAGLVLAGVAGGTAFAALAPARGVAARAEM